MAENGEKSNKSTGAALVAILVAVTTALGAIAGALITSSYEDEASKREITLQVVDFLTNGLLQEKPVILNKSGLTTSPEDLDKALRYKETAFLARQITRHLEVNYRGLDFRELRAALSDIQRRYSYAQIYQAAGLVNIVCENIGLREFATHHDAYQVSARRSKCAPSLLEGAILKVVKIDMPNARFKIEVDNDRNGVICRPGRPCSFWIDLGDRLESTPYEYLILSEFIGYEDEFEKRRPFVSFSVLQRTQVGKIRKGSPPRPPDQSYWAYKLPATVVNSAADENDCQPFFDGDPETTAQPPARELDEFDRAVLRACGPIRGRIAEAEFEALLKDHYEAAIRPRLSKAWQNRSFAEAVGPLKDIWLTYNGFDHIFCGEWEGGSIGGLHFQGRYLQLQNEGAACFVNQGRTEVDDGHIYTIPVTSADGANYHGRKGYALNQSATDLFALATTAAAFLCMGNNDAWQPYSNWLDKSFYVASSEGGKPIQSRVICKAEKPLNKVSRGLLTIYPIVDPKAPYPFCQSNPEGTGMACQDKR